MVDLRSVPASASFLMNAWDHRATIGILSVELALSFRIKSMMFKRWSLYDFWGQWSSSCDKIIMAGRRHWKISLFPNQSWVKNARGLWYSLPVCLISCLSILWLHAAWKWIFFCEKEGMQVINFARIFWRRQPPVCSAISHAAETSTVITAVKPRTVKGSINLGSPQMWLHQPEPNHGSKFNSGPSKEENIQGKDGKEIWFHSNCDQLAWCQTSSTAQIKTLALLKMHKNCQQRTPHSHGKNERISQDNQLARWRRDSKRVIGTNDFQYWSRNDGWKSSNQWRGRCQCG
jgi:hypothetical protein